MLRLVFAVLLLWTANGHAQQSNMLLDDAFVHDIYLQMNADDWQSLRDNYLDDTKYKASFTWNTTSMQNVSVRSRGSGSRNPLKPGLKIDFDAYLKDQTFDGMKSLVLDNNIQDLSFVKERTVMKVMRAMGVPAPREASVRLMINGQFVGLYTVVEPIDKVFLIKQFGENKGTLYEYNAIQPYYFEDLGPDASRYVPEMFEPKTNEDTPAADKLVAFIQLMNTDSGEGFGQKLAEFADVSKLIRFIAVQQYLAEVDGLNGWDGANNFYLYQSPASQFTFIAWDDDLSFHQPDLSILYNFDQNAITKKIEQDPALRRAYLDAVREVAELCGGPDGWLSSELDFAYRQVSRYAPEDPSVLCTEAVAEGKQCRPGESLFERESQALRLFGQQRPANVEAELSSLN